MKKQNIMESVFTEEMFTDYYVRLRPGMMCYFRSRVGREDICEDLTQDVFERIWRHRDHVRPAEVEFLIRTVARNVAADFLRRRGLVCRHMVETEDDNVFLRAAGGRNTPHQSRRKSSIFWRRRSDRIGLTSFTSFVRPMAAAVNALERAMASRSVAPSPSSSNPSKALDTAFVESTTPRT